MAFPARLRTMRLLLLEDEPLMAEAIEAHLRQAGFAVDTCPTLNCARLALQTEEFGVLLMDLGLPDGDGLTLLASIRARGQTIPVIVMTARDRISERIRGLQAGADDYLVKPFDLDEMVARIHAVVRRSEGNPSPVQAFGEIQLDRIGRRVRIRETDVELTAKEWALLEKLTSRPGATFSKEQLEQALYDFGDEVGSNTLEVYVSRLRRKLGKESIETLRGLGYRFHPN